MTVESRSGRTFLQQVVHMQEEDAGIADGVIVDVAELMRGTFEVDMTPVPASGVVSFKGSVNGLVWHALRALDLSAVSETWVTAVTDGSGLFQVDLAGLLKVKAEITVYNSGTITVWSHFWG